MGEFRTLKLKFEKKQFLHLVGVKTNLSSKHFYTKATTKNLSISEFDPRTDGTTELKLAVLPTLMDYKDIFINLFSTTSDLVAIEFES